MKPSVALMIYGDANSGRNAFTEEKYKDLAAAFVSAGFRVESVLYNDELTEALHNRLMVFDALLVWVNPIEQGKDRKKLDRLLLALAREGCFVSTHPDVILKIGTKEVLYKTRDMGWGSPAKMYTTHEGFEAQFAGSLQQTGVKVLKQYRGNGGNGVFKISIVSKDEVMIVHAKNSNESTIVSWSRFYDTFRPYFLDGGLLIEQEWNSNHANGMVRCYLCGGKVAGFGYQEINALYEAEINGSKIHLPPGKRYYFTGNCGLFSDLKAIMENNWVPRLQEIQSIASDRLPVIWDADFFINDIAAPTAAGKYSLCEINVSSVSPFPPSAIPFMVDEVKLRIQNKRMESV